MNRRWVVVLAIVASLATACSGGGSSTSDIATAAIPGPTGELETTSGSVFGFEDVVGEPTVLWFWGPG